MTILDLLFRSQADRDAMEKRNVSLTDYARWKELGWADQSTSGVVVTQENALTFSAVFGAVRILAETLATIPLITYQRLQPKGKTRAREHHLYNLLRFRPNEKMTAFEYREAKQAHLATWGNAYSKIESDGRGRVRELLLLRPDRMKRIEEVKGVRLYQYQMSSGELVWFHGDDIWHLRGLGSDGLVGYSVVGYARNTIGLGLAAQEFGSRFFANDARPGLILEHPGVLGAEALENMYNSWEISHGTLDKKHKLRILEEGMSVKEIGIPPEDAQFLETRKFQVEEIARWFRVPPHMLASMESATFSNIEHQGIEFVVQTMAAWFVRWEQSIRENLHLPDERDRFFSEFLIDGLLRGDIKTRFDAYKMGRDGGWYTVNEIREKENMNPVDGGDTLLEPMNMVPLGSQDDGELEENKLRVHGWRETEALTPHQIRSITNRRRIQSANVPLFRETLGRIYKRERQDITRAFAKFNKADDMDGFREWLTEFFVNHKAFIKSTTRTVFNSFGELIAGAAGDEVETETSTEDVESFVDKYIESFANRSAGNSEKRVLKHLDAEDPAAALESEFDIWEDNRADITAKDETVQQGSAVVKFVFILAGVRFLRWVTFGDSCPYCRRLNGKVVGIKANFINAGDEFQPEGALTALVPSVNVGHAPAHKGCDCGITAA